MSERTPKADYSAIARSYDAGRRLPDGTMSSWVELIRDRGKISPGSLCLDLGCGTGRFAIPIAEHTSASVVGADLSAEMLAEARAKPGAEHVRWVQCDAQSPAFADDSFQCVFMSLLLHHVDDIDGVVRESRRILRPGGVLLIRTSGHDDLHTMPVYHFFPRALEIDVKRLPEIGVLEESLGRAGFRSVRHEKVEQQLVTSVRAYLDKMVRKNISSLTFLSDEEFAEGIRSMRKHFHDIGPDAALAEVAAETMTLVIGEK